MRSVVACMKEREIGDGEVFYEGSEKEWGTREPGICRRGTGSKRSGSDFEVVQDKYDENDG